MLQTSLAFFSYDLCDLLQKQTNENLTTNKKQKGKKKMLYTDFSLETTVDIFTFAFLQIWHKMSFLGVLLSWLSPLFQMDLSIQVRAGGCQPVL